MLVRPRAASLAWLLWPLLGCKFQAPGLGSDSDAPVTLTGDTAADSSSSAPTTSSGTTAEPGSSSGGSESGTSGDPCADGCAPAVDWTVEADGAGYALVLDATGNVFVAGDRTQDTDAQVRDVWVARFAAEDGEVAWENGYDGGVHRTDFARALVLLGDGQVVVGGASQEDPDRRQDAWVGWFSPTTGEMLYTSNLGTSHWNGDDAQLDESTWSLALDGNGELIVGGTRCLVPCMVPDAWIGRFTSEGKTMWDDPMQSLGQGSLFAVAPLDSGLLAIGTDGYPGAPSPWRSLIRSLDANGGGIWSATQEAPADIDFESVALAFAGDGGLWVVGRELASVTGPASGFVRLYRPGDGFTPEVERRGPDLDGDVRAISLGPGGLVVVTGVAGADAGRHLWVGAFDQALEPVWRIDEAADAATSGRGLAHTTRGDLVVLGLREPGDSRPASSWLRRYSAAS